MILASLTKAIREQNWFAVVLEFLIVIAGVVIGFQITAWAQDRTDRLLEREVLGRLHADIEDSLAGQIRDIEFLQQQISDQTLILTALDNCHLDPDGYTEFERGIATLGWLNPPRLNRRTIEEISSSGLNSTINNRAIIDELAEVVSLVQWRTNAFEYTALAMNEHRSIVERHIRYDTDRVVDNPYVPDHRAGIEFDLSELCENDEVINAISAIQYNTIERAAAYRPFLEEFQNLLTVIEQELETRWGIVPPGSTHS